jgi:predicted negative regulator of RcsB-dependent stress response
MSESADRFRTLLLRGDNLLKKGRTAQAVAAFEEARSVAEDPRLRELAERRLREQSPQ